MTPDVNLLFGPPGTGKTTELLRLLEIELKTIRPDKIAYVSFTREGANQGTHRAQEMFGITEEQCRYFRTLHSMAFRETKALVTQVMGAKQYREFSRKIGMNFTGYYDDELKNNDDKYLFFDELYRNNPVAASVYLDDMDMKVLRYVRDGYHRYKKHYGYMDYTDMIANYVEADKPLDIEVAFIDEAQDLTSLQWKMVGVLTRNCKRVYIAGDDDQAIYQWSGADVEYFLGIKGNMTVLDHSYRLPDDVLNFSKTISSQITKRVNKDYHSRGVPGLTRYIKDFTEITFNPNESYMFLSRNNVFLRDITTWLRANGIVYRLKGANSVKRPDVEAINQYEELRKRPHEVSPYTRLGAALKPVYNIDDPWYTSFNWPQETIDYYRNVIGAKNKASDVRIDVSTIHSVKGAEADNVIVLSDMTKATFKNLRRNPDSEHRAFYVGCTRAKEKLFIVKPKTGIYYSFYGEESV
jgi:superfamily I DNA/RNA helicase